MPWEGFMSYVRWPFLVFSVFTAILGFTAPRSEDYCVVTFTNGQRVFAFSWVDEMDVYDLQYIASVPLARETRAVTSQIVPGSTLRNTRFDTFYNHLETHPESGAFCWFEEWDFSPEKEVAK